MFNVLEPSQVAALRALGDDVDRRVPADFQAAGAALAARLAEILQSPVVLLERRDAGWRVLADARPATGRAVDDAWTSVPIRGLADRVLLLVVGGEWTFSRPVLEDAARRWAAPLAALPDRPAPRRRRRRTRWVSALPRRLAGMRDPARVQQAIVDTCARAVEAQKASLALYDPAERSLSVAATAGYPVALVRQLRFRPGGGIIGSVFRSGNPLCIADVRQMPNAPEPRLRYRTRSFMSVPLDGSEGRIGVISVSDRRDGQPFDRRDLRLLQTLAGVATLALDRAQAFDQAAASTRVAAMDTVSGLFNRRYFLARLDEEVERARRQASPLTLLMFDLDNFKQLNDQLGHLAGDAVLRLVGDVLRRLVRLFDVCARYGGDEFAILMPGSSAANSEQIADRIRDGVQACHPPGAPDAEDLRVTASIGIATFDGTTAENLIALADQALYSAKREGKNRVRVSGAER